MNKITVISLILIIAMIMGGNIQAAEEEYWVGDLDEGSWLVRTETHPITDQKQVGIITSPSEGEGIMIVGKNLEFHEHDHPIISYSWNEDVGDEFQWRFDDDEVYTGQVGKIIDSPNEVDYGVGLYLLKSEEQDVEDYKEKIKWFAKNMIDSESVAIAPVEDVDDYMVYDLTYFGEAIEPYLDKFGWEELE